MLVVWFAAAAGCSGDGGKTPATGHAGQSAAGKGSGGKAGAAGVAEGGAAGAEAGTGGTAGGGAAAGSGGAAMAGSGGTGGVPAAWTCGFRTYGDGRCDCGCGVPDRDCTEHDLAHCESCNTFGSCNLAACPGHVDPDDTSHCVPPPAGWTCTPATYGDGQSCECGCGIVDPDCQSADAASCDNCQAKGACTASACPSSLVLDDNAHCDIPARWTCDAAAYGDGTCDCGCGVVDPDCADASALSCARCSDASCAPQNCGTIAADDNSACTTPPSRWSCSARVYHDGIQCDCGCGAIDPDCASAGADACDECNGSGSCSAQPCPGLINAAFNGSCDQPPAPDGWTCMATAYADGIDCDCGCGVPDPDCRTPDPMYCVRCYACGGRGRCEGTLDPSDTTQCAPPPSGWTCSDAAWRDLTCDCGCGVLDSACQGIELVYVCGNYPVEGCSGGNRKHIDPSQNQSCIISVPDAWTCDRTFYDDGLCDCGCGAVDLDCPTNDAAECDTCDEEGSCGTGACPGTILPNDTAHCAE